MAIFDRNYLKIDRRKRSLNNSSFLYDGINFILGLGIIVCAFLIFVDIDEYERLFTLVFFMSATMNLVMGIKYFKRHEWVKVVSFFLAVLILYAVAVISLIALWL